MTDPAEIKLGVFLGFTGPVESLTPIMATAAEHAMQEVSDSGALLGGAVVTSVRADMTCIDGNASVANAQNALALHDVDGIVGATCSGATLRVLQEVAAPRDLVMISPSSTADALTAIADQGLFFRTIEADAREGVAMAAKLKADGVDTVAVTFTNNAYGSGLADSFVAAFEAAGGRVTIRAAHEDGKSDYTAEVAALAAAGGARLVIIGYDDAGGGGIAQIAQTSGFFDGLFLSSVMATPELAATLGASNSSVEALRDGPDAETDARFEQAVGAAFDPDWPFAAESYDSAALIMLAMQAAGSNDPAIYKGFISDVANGAGVPIYAGDLERGLNILKSGGAIDYEGATGVNLTDQGDSLGQYRSISFQDGALRLGDSVVPFADPQADILTGTRQSETFKTGKGADQVDGKGGKDVLLGGAGFDTLSGGQGRDTLKGGVGKDRLSGDQGKDRLNGGKSDDVLTGGGGNDRFIFGKRDGFDVVTDWQDQDVFQIKGVSGFNRIDIDQTDAGALVSWSKTSVLVLDTEVSDLARDDFVFV